MHLIWIMPLATAAGSAVGALGIWVAIKILSKTN